ncbi:hypothetical protein M427DRAFT_338995 [Gonapodya prolifera JEL478]|uniref:Uncharacterized protein n=1 Tax=Gonapodya prolifera (strain JEL478) TaxID=1344416 RepID=A0A139ACQ5_GONPJ|nr:hypothetical protein M427DRAFT_338995 [Gonapodya prolifera JEL478]|eukprot:KXS14557.1 hypothetical protein M427DRAFT_338995 [Gonapodya prolifera JEL478]
MHKAFYNNRNSFRSRSPSVRPVHFQFLPSLPTVRLPCHLSLTSHHLPPRQLIATPVHIHVHAHHTTPLQIRHQKLSLGITLPTASVPQERRLRLCPRDLVRSLLMFMLVLAARRD